jgi:hypothetical protein
VVLFIPVSLPVNDRSMTGSWMRTSFILPAIFPRQKEKKEKKKTAVHARVFHSKKSFICHGIRYKGLRVYRFMDSSCSVC